MRIKYLANRGMPICLVAILLSLTFSGCARTVHTGVTASVVTPDFFGLGEDVALQLASNIHQPPGKGMRLILTTMVDIDDLYETSRFGRTLTEALATRLFRHGFGVVEIRKAGEILVKSEGGELMLSRDTKILSREQQADAVVVGTYSLTPNSVIVNVRLLDAGSQNVLSVAGLEVQRSANINHLLAAASSRGLMDAGLSAYER